MRTQVTVVAATAAISFLAAIPDAAAQPRSSPVSFRDCSNCPEMVILPAGSFLMGSAVSDQTADALEYPRHAVSIRRFASGKYHVTRSQWAVFVRATHRTVPLGCQWTAKKGPNGEKTASWNDLGFSQTGKDPVVCVTWRDAKDYAAWLSRRTGQRYRLLTEAEWEYASRAGQTSSYRWKDGMSHEFANHGTEDCCGGFASGRDKWVYTSPVDAFPANAFGLHDMNGNAMQWVEDCFAPDYSKTPTNGSAYLKSERLDVTGDLADLKGTLSCDRRVLRGGDWAQQVRWIRSAARSFAPPPGPGPALPDYRSGGVGFRLARDLR